MIKTWTISLLALLLSWQVSATHIVGGNFFIVHKFGPQYEINLEVFSDAQNGSPAATDLSATVGIFSKTTHQKKAEFTMPQFSIGGLPFSNPSCNNTSALVVKRVLYKMTIEMWANDYAEPGGYYLVWERCCRNHIINNIVQPGNVGNVFYLEFPSLLQNPGYSSPLLKAPTVDYACVGRDYTLDMSAIPLRGDSVSYRMITPLRGYTGVGQSITPNPVPGPYPTIIWQAPFSLTNIISGNPPLTLNATNGTLFMRPSTLGVYVFSLAVDEFKQGVKIGQVNRDFQINVVSNCPVNFKPYSHVRTSNPESNLLPTDTLYIQGDSNLCFNIVVKDSTPNERLRVRIVPKSPGSNQLFLQTNELTTTVANQEVVFTACLATCNDTTGKIWEAYIITTDNSCPKALVDTILLKYKYKGPTNEKPLISLSSGESVLKVNTFEPLYIEINGFDTTDNDFISITAAAQGFNMGSAGMRFTPGSGHSTAKAYFEWTPTCEQLDRSYNIRFTVKDNSCYQSNIDTVSLRLMVGDPVQEPEKFLPPNAFTPNGDGLNDYFQLPDLPIDNCEGRFLGYKIFNRWGRLVFESVDRNTFWEGKNEPGGLYYYLVEFENMNFKGTVQLFR